MDSTILTLTLSPITIASTRRISTKMTLIRTLEFRKRTGNIMRECFQIDFLSIRGFRPIKSGGSNPRSNKLKIPAFVLLVAATLLDVASRGQLLSATFMRCIELDLYVSFM